MNKVISIIMPMFGVEKYIDKAINSILMQTYGEWELLIVNDGSLDRSREIAQSYADKDSRIKLLDKINGGLSDARNFGLRFASGEYVHFFDSDDYIDPSYYESMVRAMNADSRSVVISGYTVDYENTKVKVLDLPSSLNLTKQELLTDGKEIINRYLNFAWNKLYHRLFLVKNKLEFEKGLSRIEDAVFFSKVLSIADKLIFLPVAGYHYVQRKEITLSTYIDSQLMNHYERSLFLYKEKLRLLNYQSEAASVLYRQFVVTSVRSYMNRLFSNYTHQKYNSYWSYTQKIVGFLHDKELSSLSKEHSFWGCYLYIISCLRSTFLLFFVYWLRSFYR